MSPLLKLPDELLEQIFGNIIRAKTPWTDARLLDLKYRTIHPRITAVANQLIFHHPVVDAHMDATPAFLHFMFFMRHYKYATLVKALTLNDHGKPSDQNALERMGNGDWWDGEEAEAERDVAAKKANHLGALFYLCTQIRSLEINVFAFQYSQASLPLQSAVLHCRLNPAAADRYIQVLAKASSGLESLYLTMPDNGQQLSYLGSDSLYGRRRRRELAVQHLTVEGANLPEYTRLLEAIPVRPARLTVTIVRCMTPYGPYVPRDQAARLTGLVKALSQPHFTSSLRQIVVKGGRRLPWPLLQTSQQDLQSAVAPYNIVVNCMFDEDSSADTGDDEQTDGGDGCRIV